MIPLQNTKDYQNNNKDALNTWTIRGGYIFIYISVMNDFVRPPISRSSLKTISLQGGPPPVTSGVVTLLSRVISYNPSYTFIRLFIELITPFETT